MKKTIIKILTLTLVAVMVCAVLASCGGPNADPDKALAALKDNGYTAEKVDSTIGLALFSWAGKDIKAIVSGTKGLEDITNSVVIIYYETTDAANAAWDDVKEYVDKNDDDEDSEFIVKKSGKMIYMGTEEAIKAAQ